MTTVETASAQWRRALQAVLRNGYIVMPQSAGGAWKGSITRELLSYQTEWPMSQPVILVKHRKLGYRFMAAEAAWICSGDNRLETIKPFSKQIHRFSDDGLRFFGAYGPKVIDQLSYVVQTILEDNDTRQAVINIWREQPRKSSDTPCTLSLQFLLRGGKLNCVATMRSSDLWTGVPYDVFNFSMISAMVALELRQKNLAVELGTLKLTAGSQHLYERDWTEVQATLESLWDDRRMPPPVDLGEFSRSSELVDALWDAARDGRYLSFMEGLI